MLTIALTSFLAAQTAVAGRRILERAGVDGYRPWLIESFVEIDRIAGTSYQAANWIEIGRTKGRGRQDHAHSYAKSVKAIYVYPLQADFRQRLGGVEPVVAKALGLADGLEGDGWAQQEFGGAKLGDRRLSERLVQSACTLATMPGQSFSGVARGDWAAVMRGFKGGWRKQLMELRRILRYQEEGLEDFQTREGLPVSVCQRPLKSSRRLRTYP